MPDERVDALATLNLLELELVAPGDERPPDELVRCDDNEDHHGQPPGYGDSVSLIGGCLKVRAEPGQAEVTRAKVKHLAGHQEEPGTRNRHDGVPYKAD